MSETKYRVNEMFYSLQAEGANAGRAAIFVRLSGCNLACPFCDTDHSHFTEMTRSEIESEADRLDPSRNAMVVFTGGEPSLQLSDEERFFNTRFCAIETNGTLHIPYWIDWVTVSPKNKDTPIKTLVENADEIKILQGVFDDDWVEQLEQSGYQERVALFVQPMADAEGRFDMKPCYDFILKHPRWRLSLQWHKLFGIR